MIYRTVGLVWIVYLTIYKSAASNVPDVVANEVHEVPIEESGQQGSNTTAIQQYDQPEQNMPPLIRWFIY